MTKKCYAICTGVVNDIGGYNQINQAFYKSRENAQNALDKLFKRCYPNGFNDSSDSITPPKYNDLTTLLQCFTTTACYHYSLQEYDFND